MLKGLVLQLEANGFIGIRNVVWYCHQSYHHHYHHHNLQPQWGPHSVPLPPPSYPHHHRLEVNVFIWIMGRWSSGCGPVAQLGSGGKSARKWWQNGSKLNSKCAEYWTKRPENDLLESVKLKSNLSPGLSLLCSRLFSVPANLGYPWLVGSWQKGPSLILARQAPLAIGWRVRIGDIRSYMQSPVCGLPPLCNALQCNVL